MILPYTICFCCVDDLVLMLYRSQPPNANLWNGLGGKLEKAETPLAGIYREVWEEAGIDLTFAKEVRFSGIVSWSLSNDPASLDQGMFAFIATFPSKWETWIEERTTPEGILGWKALSWVCNSSNHSVVSNIPYFLPQMLTLTESKLYHCELVKGQLKAVVTKPLPCDMLESI